MTRNTKRLLIAGAGTAGIVWLGFYLWKRKIPKPTKPVANLPAPAQTQTVNQSDISADLAELLFG